jgi:hypothetical protein
VAAAPGRLSRTPTNDPYQESTEICRCRTGVRLLRRSPTPFGDQLAAASEFPIHHVQRLPTVHMNISYIPRGSFASYRKTASAGHGRNVAMVRPVALHSSTQNMVYGTHHFARIDTPHIRGHRAPQAASLRTKADKRTCTSIVQRRAGGGGSLGRRSPRRCAFSITDRNTNPTEIPTPITNYPRTCRHIHLADLVDIL